MKLEEKIALLRKKQGWSQEELAFRLDVSRQAVSKWEMGDSLPDLDKIIKMSDLFGCTTDYLLKEAETECETEPFDNAEKSTKFIRTVSDEEGEKYLSLVRRLSWRLGVGVMLCVLSPVLLLILLGLAAAGSMADKLAVGMGITGIVIFCAVGVGLLISVGVSFSAYDYLEKETVSVSERMKKAAEERRSKETKAFMTAMIVGVGFCILSVIPIAVGIAFFEADYVMLYCVACLLCIVSCGVLLFARFGVIRESYSKLLQEDEYSVEKKQLMREVDEGYAGIYWILLIAGYLLVSFMSKRWDITWVIILAGALVFAVLKQIVLVMRNKKKK